MRSKGFKNFTAPLVMGATFFSGYLYGQHHQRQRESDLKQMVTLSNNQQRKENLTLNASSSKRVALIDWDNCLCNTMPRAQKRLWLVSQELERRYPGYHVDQDSLSAPWTKEFSEHLNILFGEQHVQEAKALYFEYMDHHEIPPKQPFPGAREFLESLIKANIPIAIVSNSSNNLVHHGIAHFGWGDLLGDSPIIASDHVLPNTKPNPEHFIKAIASFEPTLRISDIEEVIIIGDGADSDMLGAMNLANKFASEKIKVYAIWVTHGTATHCRLKAFSNFADIHASLVQPNDGIVSDFDSVYRKST